MTDKRVFVATNASPEAAPAAPAVALPRKPSHATSIKPQKN
jgi:hypothetical protein